MSVTVKIPTPLRPITAGLAEVKVEGANVAGRKSLAAQFPEYVERPRSARAGRG